MSEDVDPPTTPQAAVVNQAAGSPPPPPRNVRIGRATFAREDGSTPPDARGKTLLGVVPPKKKGRDRG